MSRGIPPSRMLCAVALLLACSLPLQARSWTDRTGRAVEAEFVRVTEGKVILKLPTGRVVPTPLANLSDADQAFVRQQLAADGTRVWTDRDGRQVLAKFVRYRNDNIYLKVEGKTSPVSWASLSTADRNFVRQWLEARGEADKLPAPTDDDNLPAPRTWTDTDGVSAEGQLDRVLPDGRLLLAVGGETKLVMIRKLSPDDHDYLREKLVGTELARLVPAKPVPKPVEVAANPAPPRAVAPPPVLPPARRTPTPPAPPRSPSPHPYQRRLTCTNCGREAPPNAVLGDRCPYCSKLPTPAPLPTPAIRLECNRCGRAAPPGAKFNDPCPYCAKKTTPYEMGRNLGVALRYALPFAGLMAFFLGWLWRRNG